MEALGTRPRAHEDPRRHLAREEPPGGRLIGQGRIGKKLPAELLEGRADKPRSCRKIARSVRAAPLGCFGIDRNLYAVGAPLEELARGHAESALPCRVKIALSAACRVKAVVEERASGGRKKREKKRRHSEQLIRQSASPPVRSRSETWVSLAFQRTCGPAD